MTDNGDLMWWCVGAFCQASSSQTTCGGGWAGAWCKCVVLLLPAGGGETRDGQTGLHRVGRTAWTHDKV